MNIFQDKFWLYNLFAVIGITVVMGYFVVEHNLADKTGSVPYVDLTNAEIDQIMAVKAEMQEAKIQADLDN